MRRFSLAILAFSATAACAQAVTLNANGEVEIPQDPGIGVDVAIDRLAPYITEHWVIEDR